VALRAPPPRPADLTVDRGRLLSQPILTERHMARVPPARIMALRQVTDLPVRDCQEVLEICEGDVGRVFDLMATRLWLRITSQAKREHARQLLIDRVEEEENRWAARLSDRHSDQPLPESVK